MATDGTARVSSVPFSRSRTGAPDIQARREWAENRRDHLNAVLLAREAAEAERLSKDSDTLEHPSESFEQGVEILE